MTSLLDSKTAIITGSNRGIGKKILEEFAINKSNILACSRIKDENFEKFIDSLSKKHNVKIEPVYFDFENRDEMIKQTKEKILINDKIDSGKIIDNIYFPIFITLFLFNIIILLYKILSSSYVYKINQKFIKSTKLIYNKG